MTSIKCILGYHNWTYGLDIDSQFPARLCGRCRIYQTAVINEDWHISSQPVMKWRWADDQDSWLLNFTECNKPESDLFDPDTNKVRKDQLVSILNNRLIHKGQ